MKKNLHDKENSSLISYEILPPSKSRMIVGIVLTSFLTLLYFLFSE